MRISRADAAEIANLGGWLTTVVARVCLDMLRSRKSRREELVAVDPRTREPSTEHRPEHEAVLADSIGLALLVVLETLSPAERVAFVLHDMFDVPFEEIAPIVGRSSAAARQLASSVRRRVQRAKPDGGTDARRRSDVVRPFLAAYRSGDLEGLISPLDPSVVLGADAAAVAQAQRRRRGAAAVTATFSGRARAVRPAPLDGSFALGWAQRGTLRVLFAFMFGDGVISAGAANTDRVRHPMELTHRMTNARFDALASKTPARRGGRFATPKRGTIAFCLVCVIWLTAIFARHESVTIAEYRATIRRFAALVPPRPLVGSGSRFLSQDGSAGRSLRGLLVRDNDGCNA